MRYKITLSRLNWQYCEVEVEANSKTEAVEKLKTDPATIEQAHFDWGFPEPDDEVIYPEDPETDEDVEEIPEPRKEG